MDTAHATGSRRAHAVHQGPDDVTLNLLDYDWRSATGAPQPQPPTSSHTGHGFAELLSSVKRGLSPQPTQLLRSDLAPGLVPAFFRSHLAPSVNPELRPEIQPSPSLADVTSSAGAFFAATGPQAPPKPTSAPLPPRSQFDPAASMLESLQAKLSCIEESIRTKPRTGYSAPTRGPMSIPSEETEAICDRDFVALVQCEPAFAAEPVLGKRTADAALLDAKAEDLKARNRASAKASRERKKAHLKKLHKQIDDLTTQNLELAQTCKELADDNSSIRAELRSLGCTAQPGEELVVAKNLQAMR